PAAVAARLAGEDKRLGVVSHHENRGGGAAIRSGIAAATRPLAFYMPGDGQFEPTELRRYLDASPGADIVIGVRRNRTGGWLRRLNSASYRRLVGLLF